MDSGGDGERRGIEREWRIERVEDNGGGHTIAISGLTATMTGSDVIDKNYCEASKIMANGGRSTTTDTEAMWTADEGRTFDGRPTGRCFVARGRVALAKINSSRVSVHFARLGRISTHDLVACRLNRLCLAPLTVVSFVVDIA